MQERKNLKGTKTVLTAFPLVIQTRIMILTFTGSGMVFFPLFVEDWIVC